MITIIQNWIVLKIINGGKIAKTENIKKTAAALADCVLFVFCSIVVVVVASKS